MNSLTTKHHNLRDELEHSLFVADLTKSQRMKKAFGLLWLVIGFMVLLSPIVERAWFISSFSVLLGLGAIMLNGVALITSGSLSKLIKSVGFRRYSLLVIGLLIASITLPVEPSWVFGALSGLTLLYFLAEEWLNIADCIRGKQYSSFSIHVADNVVTMTALTLFLFGVELSGELVFTLPLGVKLLLMGIESLLSSHRNARVFVVGE
jgi:hypothetical protein